MADSPQGLTKEAFRSFKHPLNHRRFALALFFSLTGSLTSKHTSRLEVLSLYWHFVDAVWVVVFTVVYVLGR